jgi:hypothetical protein
MTATIFATVAAASGHLSNHIADLCDRGEPDTTTLPLLQSWDHLRRALCFLPASDDSERKIHAALFHEFSENPDVYADELAALGEPWKGNG